MSSRAGAGAPGLQYSQTASLLAWKRADVRAFFSAMSIDPRTAPSIRAEGLQMHAGVDDGDDHRHADRGGLGFGRGDDGAGLS